LSEEKCTECAPGTSSPGSGEYFLAAALESGSALPSQLSSTCAGTGCKPFVVSHRQFHANSTDSTGATLRYTTRYMVTGSISFSYSMFGIASQTFGSTPSLIFSMDDQILLSDSNTTLHSATPSFEVRYGAHTFTWVVSGSVKSVDIDYIVTFGNVYAPTSCTACPNGYYQDESAQGMCKRCPSGKISAPGFTDCQDCPEGSYTIDGVQCIQRPECKVEDWVALFTPCSNRTRQLIWTKLYPAVCEGGYNPGTTPEEVECDPCGTGMWREEGSDECVGCKVGEVFDGGDCVKPDQGTVSYHTREYFGSKSNTSVETVLPDGWTTSGFSPSLPAGSVPGWRLRADGIDAGFSREGDTVITVLSYTASEVVSNGFIVFDYRINETKDELLFFINNRPVTVTPTQLPNGFLRIQTDMPSGTGVTLTWMAVMGSGNAVSAPSVMIQNVRVGGLTSGYAYPYYCKPGTQANEEQSACEVCQAGTASSITGSSCRACPSGTYSARSGESKCSTCYNGTSSEAETGSKRCVTQCKFDGWNNTVYDLTKLRDVVIGPVTTNSFGGSFFFSVCDGVMPKGKCSQSATDDENMHVCFANGMSPMQMDFGSELEYVLAEEGSPEEDLSFMLNFHDGQTCFGNADMRMQTSVLFRCSPSAGVGYPQFLSFSFATCTATFSWASQYACHQCTNDDYELVVSACTDGSQLTERHRINNCYGPDRMFVADSPCTDIAVPIGLAAGALALIIIMIGVIIFVVYKNRKITIKYTKLLADQSAELEAMADEVADNGSASTKLVPPTHDDEEDDSHKKDGDSDDEPRDDDEEEDDDQGVGYVRK